MSHGHRTVYFVLTDPHRMAEYVESKEKAQKSTLEAQKAKLQTLERQLGIQPSSSGTSGIGSSTAAETSNPAAASSSTASISKPAVVSADVDVTKIAQKRHRFDDNQYFETSREINDSVRSAVTAGK